MLLRSPTGLGVGRVRGGQTVSGSTVRRGQLLEPVERALLNGYAVDLTLDTGPLLGREDLVDAGRRR